MGEGGVLEFDGEGMVLIICQCLFNFNCNFGFSECQVEDWLKVVLGVEKVLWIDEGMIVDYIDGYIDNIVCFVWFGVVVCQMLFGVDDKQVWVFFVIL